MTDPQPIPGTDRVACNCHYPIGLVVFLAFTIVTLLACICVCCFDITKCSFYQRRKEKAMLRRASTFDPRFMDGPRIQRKFSVDPRLFEGHASRSASVAPMLPNGHLYAMHFHNEALVSTV